MTQSVFNARFAIPAKAGIQKNESWQSEAFYP